MEKVNFDQYYERKLNEHTEDLKFEYQPKIDEAADLGYVVNKINDEVLAKIKSFYSGSKGSLIQPDFYKKDLLLGFKDCLKSYKNNPVEQFIISELPKIRSEHQAMIKEGHVHGYELDPEFINVTDYKVILGFIANYYAYDEVSRWLKHLLGNAGTMKQNNESELTNNSDNLNTMMELEDNPPINGLDSSQIKVDLLKKGTKKPRKTYETFESLFIKKKHAVNLVEFLIRNNILDKKGNWIGTTNKRTEFIALIKVLKSPEFMIIKFSSSREVGRLFALKFKIGISDRSLTLHTASKVDVEPLYKKLISDFLSECEIE